MDSGTLNLRIDSTDGEYTPVRSLHPGWPIFRIAEEMGFANVTPTVSLLMDATRPVEILDEVTWERLCLETKIIVHREPGKWAHECERKAYHD